MPEEAFKEDVPDLAGDSGGTGGGKEKSPVDKVTRIKYEKIYGIKIPVPFVNKDKEATKFFKLQERYEELAKIINDKTTQKTKEGMGWLDIQTKQEVLDQITEVTSDDVKIMINNWVEETIATEYEGVNSDLFFTNSSFRQIPPALHEYFLEVAFNPEKYNQNYSKEYYKNLENGDLGAADNLRLFITASSVAADNSVRTADFDIEPGVGAYITEERKIYRFLSALQATSGDNTLLNNYVQNPTVRKQLQNSWPNISTEINKQEGNKAGQSFHVGASKYALDVAEDTDDAGWVLTQFTNNPVSIELHKIQKDIVTQGEERTKLLANDPVKVFKQYLPSDESLKKDIGQWAVDAKKLYVARFEDTINESRIGAPNRDTNTLAAEANALIVSNQDNWENFLQEAQDEYEQGVTKANYSNLVSQFETFSKAKSAITNWLGGRQVSQNFQNRLANHLTNPRMIDPNAQNTGQAIESLIQNVLSPEAELTPEQLLSNAQDYHTLSNMTLDTSNTQGAKGARQRQGYAYTPQGQLKPYTAERNVIDPNTGERKRIRESGAQLMANLHLYPELVQRTILYGINRPQQEITSYQDIGITPLPPAFFEGIEGQGRYFGDVPMHGGTFAFDKNYIATPDLTPQFDFSYSMIPSDNVPDKIEIPETAPAVPPLPQMRNPNLDFGGV